MSKGEYLLLQQWFRMNETASLSTWILVVETRKHSYDIQTFVEYMNNSVNHYRAIRHKVKVSYKQSLHCLWRTVGCLDPQKTFSIGYAFLG